MSEDGSEIHGPIVAVVGLGYVGLPLALAFGRILPTMGFDISERKIDVYKQGYDPTGEMDASLFQRAAQLHVTSDAACIRGADFIIVTVPTPVNNAHQPDLSPVIHASETVGRNLGSGSIVVFESTVYPGVTEDVCVPILERESGLKCGQDFTVAYSPERVNPGDQVHRLENTVKIVSAQDNETLDKVAGLYARVIDAGVHRAQSIKVAEAAKVVENTQRDLNIALMNELAMIFDRLGIDTLDVLEAAGTKWNFLPFRPGLVGGHCIGVDPYYLAYKAEVSGYHPDVILSARHINDGMGYFVAQQTIRKMIGCGVNIKGARVLVLGLTFKEGCADLRNSRVVDVIRELEGVGIEVLVHDPIADARDARHEHGIDLVELDDLGSLDAIVAAVAHRQIVQLEISQLSGLARKRGIPFIDVKAAFDRDALRNAGFSVWRL